MAASVFSCRFINVKNTAFLAGLRRASSLSNVQEAAVVYDVHGDPTKVLSMRTRNLVGELSDSDVLVKMLAAPINPSDINMIQGVYPVKPAIPAIGGNEGVGVVQVVGKSVCDLKPGDWVVPSESGWGTWRTYAVTASTNLLKIPNNLPVINAATMAVNPCTAYRMLTDFVSLKPGDVVIQNGANSAVGQAVIQIAAELGVTTINIIRNRPNIDELVSNLKAFGANYILTDEEIRKPDGRTLMSNVPKAKLGLNGVGGKAAAELMKWIDKKGSMVTYGGMSKQPLMIPAGPLIFNDVKVLGYWMTQWNKDNRNSPERRKMWEFLSDMVIKGSLKAPIAKATYITDYQAAIEEAMESFKTKKQILMMEKSLLNL